MVRQTGAALLALTYVRIYVLLNLKEERIGITMKSKETNMYITSQSWLSLTCNFIIIK